VLTEDVLMLLSFAIRVDFFA